MPHTSVVIPCLNEAKYVPALLNDLANQTCEPYEVIIADSQSTDATIAEAEKHASRLPLRVVRGAARTPGAARNAGAKQAHGQYLIFIDADVRLPSNALEITEQSFDDTTGFLSPLYTAPGHHPFDQLAIYAINNVLINGRTAKHHVPGIGCFMAVRRAVHEAVGGFDPDLVKANDIEYLTRLREHGVTYKIMRDLKVETSNRRHQKDGRFIALLNYTPERSWLGKQVVYPFLQRIGKDKRYGIF